jgi:hypothetical protein
LAAAGGPATAVQPLGLQLGSPWPGQQAVGCSVWLGAQGQQGRGQGRQPATQRQASSALVASLRQLNSATQNTYTRMLDLYSHGHHFQEAAGGRS